MKRFIIRHAESQASDAAKPLFGKEGAPLNDVGIMQAKALREVLASEYSIDAKTESVATSQLIRARQTAEKAGFEHITSYPSLNEAELKDLVQAKERIANKQLPDEAIAAAKALIANPPPEQVLVTHGLIIAALAQELGIDDGAAFIPGYCAVRVMEF